MPPDPISAPDAAGRHGDRLVDPDFDRHDPDQRSTLSTHPWALPAISAGGMIGASGRYGLETIWPHQPTDVPWATFLTNVTGCLLLGILMVALTEMRPRHPLWRLFLGVGVMGGFTTFSTYVVQVQQSIDRDAPILALGYLFGTLAAALIAVTVGTLAARAVVKALGIHEPVPDVAQSHATRGNRDSGEQGHR
jgi:CrcB protein